MPASVLLGEVELAELLDCARAGRATIILRIATLVAVLKREREEKSRAYANLTDTQTRCNDLLRDARVLRTAGDLIGRTSHGDAWRKALKEAEELWAKV
jgi:hypothetical protein